MLIREFWNEKSALFDSEGFENGRATARLLLMKALNYDYTQFIIHLEQPLSLEASRHFSALSHLLEQHIPLQYILGKQEFMGLDFMVDERVLIPRPETEILVQTIVNCLGLKETGHIADIGTGSGAIVVSLASLLPNAHFSAVDISEDALSVALHNATLHGVTSRIDFHQGNMLAGLPSNTQYRAIVSNPPYITSEDMATLPQNVRYEPNLALFGGADGLDFYRQLAKDAPALLARDGLLAVEIGWQQGPAVQKLWLEAGLTKVEIIQDFADHDRVVIGYKT